MPKERRYELCGTIGSGATSIVHVARLSLADSDDTKRAPKLVAVKRLHPHLADDAKLRAILLDEARLMSRISHPNVVAVLDVAEEGDEVFLVLEYARGATLAELLRKGPLEPAIAIAVLRDVLAGLHAAHHARGTDGALLGLVHRDVTPRNVIVTSEGTGKILDFGIAKARARISTTRDGHVRGSLPYMAPEQLKDEPLGARTDLYGAGVVLWEALTGKRLFEGETEAAIIQRILDHRIDPPSVHVPGLPSALDAVILRALASDPEERPRTGLEMALALETSMKPAAAAAVAAWVERSVGSDLEARDERIASAQTKAHAVLVIGESGSTKRESASTARIVASSSSRTPEAPKDPSRGRVRVAVLLGLLLVAGGAAAYAMRAPTDATAITTTTTTESTRVETATSSLAATASASTVAPTPGASIIATSASTPVSVVSARPVISVRPSAAPVASSAKRAPCTPYWVDDAGHRRFNRDCLE
jgi:eukaryotic-like serine/threonine-protein kinase